MARCPNCHRGSEVFELVAGMLVAGRASLAGVQPKFSARLRGTLTCMPDRGGCGFQVSGRVVDGDLEVSQEDVRAALAAVAPQKPPESV